MFDEIDIYGQRYKTRWIDLESHINEMKTGNTFWGTPLYQIATEDLSKILYPDGEHPISKEAELIDEHIFCYVPNDILNDSEENILSFIRENII